ncbi:hypothetical protein CKM354_001234400 [Cercospora kikuchii]|uniref:Mid2 domain-containing protein n=1 Tax=Cercospora kikuchii TaxID=84275 RepID=A0A9P3FLT6_9PEZI|nr:uncharacterized protein CKM354_001234400 [Cercospora kikuchii]GIZ49312.1 hypothetical protein CKM354_001234400 [Cercospora kikuchii]
MLRFQYIAFWLATCARLGVQQSPGGALAPYDDLSDTPVTGDVPTGNFTYPAGPVQIYTLGKPMTVAWKTRYAAVNLYVLFNGSVNGQTQLAGVLNLRAESYQWTVSCGKGDCSTPYFFRAVNSAGTNEELTIGGFTSRQFWIQPSDDESRTSSSSSSTTSTTTSTERASPTTSVTSTTIAVRTTTMPTTQAVVPTPTSTTETKPTNTLAIGAGVGVGGAIAILAAGGLLFWLLRKRRIRKQQWAYSVADAQQSNSSPPAHQEKLPAYQVYPPQELYSRSAPQEMPS